MKRSQIKAIKAKQNLSKTIKQHQDSKFYASPELHQDIHTEMRRRKLDKWGASANQKENRTIRIDEMNND